VNQPGRAQGMTGPLLSHVVGGDPAQLRVDEGQQLAFRRLIAVAKLTEKDGWLYGRGTIDMKDGDAALLESLIRLKREHFKPARDVIVAFTADEEAGGDANGPAFLLKEHRDLIDAGLVINLDGGGSTTMVVRNKLVNKPSDTTGERPVSDAILIYPR